MDECNEIEPIIISDKDKSELARLTKILEDRNNSIDQDKDDIRTKYEFATGLFVFPLITDDNEDGYDKYD